MYNAFVKTYFTYYIYKCIFIWSAFIGNIKVGRPWPYRYSSCTTNVYNLDAYAGARGFDPELRQYVSRGGAKSLWIDGGL